MTAQVQRISASKTTREVVEFNTEVAQAAIDQAKLERANLARAQERARKKRLL